MVSSVFVYGTLKRGQCREGMWPETPLSVTPAWTRGRLFAGAHYPAVTTGSDRVLGESWRFDVADMESVLKWLDCIEGTNQPGREDLYLRFKTEVLDLDDEPLGTAWVYHYAKPPEHDGFTLQFPRSPESYVAWPDTDSA